ncbi:hypothetical protein [Trichocoleus sp. FACHB-262]|nr:hypothetical protein [Trichocoleus sp. FACHB-262]
MLEIASFSRVNLVDDPDTQVDEAIDFMFQQIYSSASVSDRFGLV